MINNKQVIKGLASVVIFGLPTMVVAGTLDIGVVCTYNSDCKSTSSSGDIVPSNSLSNAGLNNWSNDATLKCVYSKNSSGNISTTGTCRLVGSVAINSAAQQSDCAVYLGTTPPGASVSYYPTSGTPLKQTSNIPYAFCQDTTQDVGMSCNNTTSFCHNNTGSHFMTNGSNYYTSGGITFSDGTLGCVSGKCKFIGYAAASDNNYCANTNNYKTLNQGAWDNSGAAYGCKSNYEGPGNGAYS